MFYLSRAEQAALLVLLVLLLAGAGVLTYQRGRHSADAAAAGPLFVPAPTAALAPGAAAPAGARALSPSANIAPPGATPNADAGTTPRAQAKPPSGAAAAGAKPLAGNLISLNTATQKELDSLPGIGPVLAQRIIAYREQRKREGHRGFEAKDELLNVPGIGPKRYSAIRDLATL